MQLAYKDIKPGNFNLIIYDTITLRKTGVDLISETVMTQTCNHPQQNNTVTLKEALQQINTKSYFQCSCGEKAKSIAELCKDIKGMALENFHSLTDTIQVVQGIMTHKYIRKPKFTKILSQAHDDTVSRNLVRDIYDKYHPQNSISSLIKKQGFEGSQNSFWAYCLLDKVKITIPVRLLKCQHPSCYELTSLLSYQQQQLANKDQIYQQQIGNDINDSSIIFHCTFPGCQTKIDIQSLQIMLSELVIDQELLNLLNSAPSIQFKFTYDFQRNCFKKDFLEKDPYILDINQSIDQMTYNKIMTQIQAIMQIEINQDIQDKLNQQKFQDRIIDLVDPINGKQVEFPVRCVNCPNINKCADIRTYVAYFIKTKVMKAQSITSFKCPICQSNLETKTALLNQLIYYDENIMSRMFKESNTGNLKQFNYNGKQYMLEEFQFKQKFSKENYTKILQQKKDNNGDYIKEVQFDKLKCIVHPNKRLQNPLIIKQCQSHSYVDFDSFYEKMLECKFIIPEEGIQLCRCNYCSTHPILKYTTSIFYHEALGEALKKLKKEDITPSKFKYNFEKGEFILMFGQNNQQSNAVDQTIINEGKFNFGFIDLLSDEEYQNVFRPKTLDGKVFQILSVQQSVAEGLDVTHNANGVQINVEEKINSFNQNVNKDMKKFHFQLNAMKVEMQDDIILFNKGGVDSSQFNTQLFHY